MTTKVSISKIIGGLWFCSFIMALAKLFGVINFSWWLVTSPVWLTVSIFVVFVLSLFIFLMTRSEDQLDTIEKRIKEIEHKYGISNKEK